MTHSEYRGGGVRRAPAAPLRRESAGTDRFTRCLGDAARAVLIPAVLAASAVTASVVHAESGVVPGKIRMGGVMDLEGRARGLGQGMKTGIQAAFEGVRIGDRELEFLTQNDSYDPPKTIEATEEMISNGVLLMVGNVGTPTAKVSLPILARNDIPAVGFFTGAGLLRPGNGDIVNYRASYVQETERVISAALDADARLQPSEVCAYVQNDAYGMAGVTGIKRALSGRRGSDEIVERLDDILQAEGDPPERNGIGPVGVYIRSSVEARQGYLSLKQWEREQDTQCRLVVTVGAYGPVAQFAGYSRFKDEDWVISAVSFTGADNLRIALRELRIHNGVVMTQVVPHASSPLPIVAEAQDKLGERYGYVSLEGYIVGKMTVQALRRIDGRITRDAFLDAILDSTMDIGGLSLDFTDDNQGSDLVIQTVLEDGGFELMSDSHWKTMLQ